MLAIGLGLTLAVGFLVLREIVHTQMLMVATTRLESRMRAITDYAEAHPGEEFQADRLLEFRTQAHQDYFEIWDSGGRLLARSASSGGKDLPRPSANVTGETTSYELLLPDGHRGIAVMSRTQLPSGDPRGHLQTVVAGEIEALKSLESQVDRALLLIAVFCVVGGVMSVRFALEFGLHPLARLDDKLAAIDPDGPRVDPDFGRMPRELAVPAKRMASLLNRVFDSRDRERRFTRSVAHELRTPLAEMRMIADVGAMSDSVEETKAALLEISAATMELQEIIDTLLALARYESGQEQPQTEPVELAGEVRHQLAAFATSIRQRSLRINCDLPQERWIVTDTGLVRRLIANLVGNAVSHSPPGSVVWVALRASGPLRISNVAPHLQAADVPRLGERFYRVDSGSIHDHVGLGLALASAIAGVTQLQLTLQLDEAKHFVATLGGFHDLPLGAAHGPHDPLSPGTEDRSVVAS